MGKSPIISDWFETTVNVTNTVDTTFSDETTTFTDEMTTDTTTDPPDDPLSPGAITGIVIASIVALALLAVAGFVLYRKRKSCGCCYGNAEGRRGDQQLRAYKTNTRQGPHYQNGPVVLDEEFQGLQTYIPSFSTNAASEPRNLKKNRFSDILPYDKNRVRLNNGGYINASFINHNFIATQDPMMPEDKDFWPMVWENDVRIMVRLSTDVKGVTTDTDDAQMGVAVYFPPEDRKWVLDDDLELTNAGVQKTNDYTKTLLLAVQGSTSREVHHYHVQNWESSTFPAVANTLETVNEIKTTLGILDTSNQHKILVHCGAGTGRTGTFIAIWTMMDSLDRGYESNVLNLCKTLREQRTLMVSNESQYRYIHQCKQAYHQRGMAGRI